jgi:hypothetical protein
MDKDILTALVTILFILAVLFYSSESKYKMSARRWIGAILTLVGIYTLFINGNFFNFSDETIGGLISLFGGLCLWFIKPTKKENKNETMKKPKKKFVIILVCLFVAILFIIFIRYFIIETIISSGNSVLTEQSNVTPRDCVLASNGIMSCDGTGITNEQECKDVCLEENGLTNTRYITNMSVNSKNLVYVTFNGCYCYDGDNIKYVYVIST